MTEPADTSPTATTDLAGTTPADASPTDGSPTDTSHTLMQRRRLISRGAAVAGAAAGAVALGIAGATPASATDGDALKQGGTYTGGSTTTLAGGSSTTPTLRLLNATGPSLELTAFDDFDKILKPGQVVATKDRLLLGAVDGDDAYTAALATLDDINVTIPVTSTRLTDTRSADDRNQLVGVGGAGFDSAGRLRAQSFIDVYVSAAGVGPLGLDAIFLNLTSTGSTGNGFLLAYPPGDRPVGSTTSYQKGVTTASSCLTGLEIVDDAYVVRIYTSATTHVIVDLTGVVAFPQATAAVTKTTRMRRPASRRPTWTPARRR